MPPQASPAASLVAAAIRLLKAGRPGEAVAPLRGAAALQPSDPSIQHDLGLACLETGRVSEAVAALRCATALNPRYTDAHFRLGIALERLGDTAAAVLAYDRTTELLPSHTEAWFRAGALVFTMGHRDEAVGCFRRAASTGRNTSFGRLGAARALLAEERDAEAERALRRLLALDVGNPMALDLLGNLLADAGRFEEARDCFARAIDRAPLMAGSYYDLVRCGPVSAEEAHLLPRMQAALATSGLDDAQRLRVHLALGKAADDLGDYRLAMQHFDAADSLRRGPLAWDPAVFDAEVSRLIARFTPELVARAPSLGIADPTPVFILGLPRSGTTLVEQIVSSHNDVAGAGELTFWTTRGPAWNRMEDAGTQMSSIRGMAADYGAVLRAAGPAAARVTDKMPFNFVWAGLIHLALPDATLVHCRRNPIDTALSIHQTHFHPSLAFPTGGAELVAYMNSYRRLTDHWRRVLPADRFVEVEYEALTRSPATEIPRLVAACGLGWDDACLHPERNGRVVRTASRWQARQPIHRGAVERWRRYEPWLGALRPLLAEPAPT